MTLEMALEKAAAWCASSEHCRQEVRRKLQLWGMDTQAQERALEWLVREDFINEDRYARAFVRDKARFLHWGPIKIRQGLLLKGIAADLIERHMGEVEDEDVAVSLEDSLEAYLRRRLEALRAKGLDEVRIRASLLRSGASRGFGYGDVQDVLQRLGLGE